MKRPSMDVKTKRRLRLLQLIELEGGRGKGGIKKVADKVSTDPNYLSQLLSVKADGKKANIGDALAAKIAAAYGKPVGWMDTYYSDNFVEEMLWVYEHAPEEGKLFLESSVEVVRIRYLKDEKTQQI